MPDLTKTDVPTPSVGINPKDPLGSWVAATGPVLADLRKQQEDMRSFQAEATGFYKDSADETNRILSQREGEFAELEGQVKGLAQEAKGLPKPPAAPAEPAVPSMAPRPFLNLGDNPSLVQSLNTTLYSLGLLAQMGMGMAKGYPAGALAAYSGALEGWAKGDAVRAENMWKEYLASVGKMTREYQRQRQEYQDIMDRFGLSKDMVATQLSLAAAKNGLTRERIQLAAQKPEEFMKVHQLWDPMINNLGQQSVQITGDIAKAMISKQVHEETAAYRERLLQLKEKEMSMMGGMGGGGLSQSALEREARAVAAGAPMPSLGWGKTAAALRIQIANRAAEIQDQAGDSAGAYAMRRATYAGSKAELTKLLSQRGPLMAFAATADKNLAVAESLSERVDRSGSPVLNRWFLAGRRATGDPDVAAFDTAVRVAINEFAKVTSSATGGGVTSDTARKEVETMLNAAQTPKQFKAVVKTLRQEMENRKQGYEEQIQVIQQGLGGTAPKAQGGVGQELEQELGLK